MSALSITNAKVHYHDFVVQATPVKRLCKTHNTITVNGMYPGPTLRSTTVTLLSSTPLTELVTMSPFTDQERVTHTGLRFKDKKARFGGTLTVLGSEPPSHGALIIRPREGDSYPFPKPKRETPLLLGEWWDANPIDVVRQATRTGAAPNVSDAYTINGQPGDLYNCSSKDTITVPVDSGETNLLRVVNSGLNQQLFFKVANHKLTVVGADASYVKPFTTSVLMLGPGQTTDVLITADQPPAKYYIAARAYASAQGAPFDNTTTTAILEYKSAACSAKCAKVKPIMPTMPAFNDTATATAFTTSFRSPGKTLVPTKIDHNLFFTVGLGLNNCPRGARARNCQGPNGTRFAASMNNVSFVLPSNFSLLQAHQQGIPGVFTTDFPANPPVKFDYTGNVSRSMWQPIRGTKLYKLKYGESVQVVLQGTSIFTAENHPIHLHGYDFYIVAEGFGNFNPSRDTAKFNLVNPPLRNTASVPVGGWAVIRFVADNPG
ncbi:hypothetical protein DH2020_022382 [Rehmannia glutinosa]|uniref:Laccase n=1 Tax=Rehmannia glutinosa TaxID=99300 RepID=A0ABR0WD74_REHGL